MRPIMHLNHKLHWCSVHRNFMNEEQDISLRFMAAYLKGVRDYNDAFIKGDGKDEVIDIMTKHTALKDPELWEKVNVTGLDPDGKMFIDDIKKQYEAVQSKWRNPWGRRFRQSDRYIDDGKSGRGDWGI